MVAPRYGLDTLIAVVDHNRLQQFGRRGASGDERLPPERPGELAARFAAFGWRVMETDGHAMAEFVGTLEAAAVGDGRPTAMIADTVKGKGVSFMEGSYRWHIGVPTDEQMAAAMAELGEPVAVSADGSP